MDTDKKLVQLHWMQPNDPNKTILVAQCVESELVGYDAQTNTALNRWADRIMNHRKHRKPTGWTWTFVNEGDPRFVKAA